MPHSAPALTSTAILILPPVTQSWIPAQLTVVKTASLERWKKWGEYLWSLPPAPSFCVCFLQFGGVKSAQHTQSLCRVNWEHKAQLLQPDSQCFSATGWQCSKSHLRVFNFGAVFFHKNLLTMRTIPLSPDVEFGVSLSTKSTKIYLETALPIPSFAIQELHHQTPSALQSLACLVPHAPRHSLPIKQDPSFSHSHQHSTVSSSVSPTVSHVFPYQVMGKYLLIKSQTPLHQLEAKYLLPYPQQSQGTICPVFHTFESSRVPQCWLTRT